MKERKKKNSADIGVFSVVVCVMVWMGGWGILYGIKYFL